jgi:hypothetical protein
MEVSEPDRQQVADTVASRDVASTIAAMGEHARSDDPGRSSRERPAPSAGSPRSGPVRSSGPTPTQALVLQRTAGNRAATRVLSRWAAHPDKDKKGVLMPDPMAAEFLRFNPPLSK